MDIMTETKTETTLKSPWHNIRTVLQKHLMDIGACREARAWARNRSPQQAWDECPRADWLLWWSKKTPVNKPRDIESAVPADYVGTERFMCREIRKVLVCPFREGL